LVRRAGNQVFHTAQTYQQDKLVYGFLFKKKFNALSKKVPG
jgi:hypothetical protein